MWRLYKQVSQLYSSNWPALTQMLEVGSKPKKQQNGHNSVPRPKIKKIRPHYFLQFLKLKEIKWSYFFDLRPRGRVMAVLSIFRF